MADAGRVATLRAELPVTAEYVFLNSGTCGPIARPVHEVMAAHADRELREGRIGARARAIAQELEAASRAAIASVIGAAADQIALTHHTTEGVNIVVWGLDWRSGDEILSSDLEHASGLLPAYGVAKRYDARLRLLPLQRAEQDPTDAIIGALTDRTKLVIVSHVVYGTGQRLDVGRIAGAAHAVGARVLVDGAQSVGVLPLNVADLGVDFYTVSGQKWLGGPVGTGGLYVAPGQIDALRQTFLGYHSVQAKDFAGDFTPKPGAQRFEDASYHDPSLAGQAASVDWLREKAELDWVYARIAEQAGRARRWLRDVPGLRLLTPDGDGQQAGLVSFLVDDTDPQRLVEALARRRILCRYIPSPYCARVSIGFFTTDDEIGQLVGAIDEIRQSGEARPADAAAGAPGLAAQK
ncbi:MAG TPA: aminotransferase class V-fold PLP-dependent enzyme [Dehalococcoidia bacterium]|nr:aminotransferase class V-fold PLP-dependent enzyme [Dehalococcoidia bacterium]